MTDGYAFFVSENPRSSLTCGNARCTRSDLRKLYRPQPIISHGFWLSCGLSADRPRGPP